MEQQKEESFLFKNYDSMTLNNYILLKPSTLQPVFALFVYLPLSVSSFICAFSYSVNIRCPLYIKHCSRHRD